MTLNSKQWQALKQGLVPVSKRATAPIFTLFSWLIKGSIVASIGMAGVFAFQHYQQADSSIPVAAFAEDGSSDAAESTFTATVIQSRPKRMPRIRLHELPSSKSGSTPSLWQALEGVHRDD